MNKFTEVSTSRHALSLLSGVKYGESRPKSNFLLVLIFLVKISSSSLLKLALRLRFSAIFVKLLIKETQTWPLPRCTYFVIQSSDPCMV